MAVVDFVLDMQQVADRHPRLRRLHDYWQDKRGDADLPRKVAIDPTEIPELLGNIVLFEVVGGGADFRCRVIGDVIEEIAQRSLTGALTSRGRTPVFDPAFERRLRQVVARAVPMFWTRRQQLRSAGDLIFDTLLLPLAGPGAASGAASGVGSGAGGAVAFPVAFIVGAMYPRLH